MKRLSKIDLKESLNEMEALVLQNARKRIVQGFGHMIRELESDRIQILMIREYLSKSKRQGVSDVIKKIAVILFVLMVPSIAQAQATSTNKLTIDQGAPDLATANSYIYKYYPDNTNTGIVITMVCTGVATPFVCSGAFPAFTPGAHTLTLTASNLAGESAKSVVLSFTFVVIPSAPLNPRIQ